MADSGPSPEQVKNYMTGVNGRLPDIVTKSDFEKKFIGEPTINDHGDTIQDFNHNGTRALVTISKDNGIAVIQTPNDNPEYITIQHANENISGSPKRVDMLDDLAKQTLFEGDIVHIGNRAFQYKGVDYKTGQGIFVDLTEK